MKALVVVLVLAALAGCAQQQSQSVVVPSVAFSGPSKPPSSTRAQTMAPVLPMIRHHHERYDGRGYPDGLRGEAIPFEVRLLSIVDAYDALTSHRAYRAAPLGHAAAMETLRREAAAGKWDAQLVDAFARMMGTTPPDWPS